MIREEKPPNVGKKMKCDKSSLKRKAKPKLFLGEVSEVTYFTNEIVRLSIYQPNTAQNSKPGQFVNIKVSKNVVPLLRRPFSINRVNKDTGTFDILFQVIGHGTRLLSEFKEGDKIDCLGPLGNHFSYPRDSSNCVILAGGLGIAPLEFLAQELLELGNKVQLFWGNRSRDQFEACQANFENVDCQFSTDDGSWGFKGTVTKLFETTINNRSDNHSSIYACGPAAMLREVQKIAERKNITCQISLENMMACGFGVCMGCNVNSTSPKHNFKYVCTDGPVFDAREIKISG